jgi:hypothetical protein
MISERGPVTLTARDAETVATCAIKTALVAGGELGRQSRRVLRPVLQGPSTRRIVRVFGRTRYLQTHTIDFRPMTVRREGEERPAGPNCYEAVLSGGHLALYIVGWLSAKPQLNRIFSYFGDTALVKVWPFRPPVRWPLRRRST